MRKMRIVLAMFVAFAGLAVTSSAASAVTVSPAGAITASFPAGGLTFRTPFSNTSCAINFNGSVNTAGSGSITAATIIPNPCNGITYNFLFPWTVSVGAPAADGLVTITVSNIGVEANIFGTRCLFSGTVRLTGRNGAGTILPPVGTLTGPCGTATVGGTGGRLSPAQTVTP